MPTNAPSPQGPAESPRSSQSKSPNLAFRLALLVWSVVAVAVVVLYGGSAMDDFFILYRYAENFAHGNGFVFNPGERVFGLTEPAWGFALGIVAWLTRLPVPWLGSSLFAVALVALAALLVLDERRRTSDGNGGLRVGTRVHEAAALLGGTLLVTQTFLWACRGAGVVPGLALLALAAFLRERPIAAGLLAALAVGCRPELAVGAVFLALVAWIEERRFPLRLVAAGAAGGVVLGAALRLWFGAFLPITMGAKRDFAAWDPVARASGRHFWPGFVEVLARHWGATWPIFFAVGAIGAVLALRRGGRATRVLVATGAALAVAYPLLGVPLFGWYTIPTLVAAMLGFAWAVVAAAEALGRFLGGRSRIPESSIDEPIATRAGEAIRSRAPLGVLAAHGAVAAAAAFLLLPSAKSLAWGLTHPEESLHYRSYRDAGRWIAERSAPDERIAALEVGTLACASDRTVIDLLGLVSPGSLAHVAEHRVIDTLRDDLTEWFVFTDGLEGLIGPVRTLPWFAERYELAHTLPGVDGEMWIYRRKS